MSQRNFNKKLNQQQAQAALNQIMNKAAENLSPISCQCGCSVYTQGVMVKVITRERLSLMGGPNTEADVIYQTPQLCCVKCGEPFQPPKEEVKLS